jgi:hypothetical protein
MAAAEQPSSAGRHSPGLRTLSPDQIGKAINETEKQANSIHAGVHRCGRVLRPIGC